MNTLLPWILVVTSAPAEEMRVHRDIAYAEPKHERQMLDVYRAAQGQDRPVILWIHGGGWKRGDKSNVQQKPRAFTERGFVFVSTNYRFVPQVTIRDMTADIARAIRWVHDHAREYGGDPESIFVMGHSAGAHLAALVCTDDRYLRSEGMSLATIKGCTPVDVSVYDIPKRLTDTKQGSLTNFRSVFGEDAALHRDWSPVSHVTAGKSIPSFLILHVAARQETRVQSVWFAEKLKEAGVEARVVSAEDKTHGTINTELGLAEDKPTQEIYMFMEAVLKNE